MLIDNTQKYLKPKGASYRVMARGGSRQFAT